MTGSLGRSSVLPIPGSSSSYSSPPHRSPARRGATRFASPAFAVPTQIGAAPLSSPTIRHRIDKRFAGLYHTLPYGTTGAGRLAAGGTAGAVARRRRGGAPRKNRPRPAGDQRELLLALPEPRGSPGSSPSRVGDRARGAPDRARSGDGRGGAARPFGSRRRAGPPERAG